MASKKPPFGSKPRGLAPERGGEVEAEAVDVHLLDPVAQRIGDQLQHARVGHVDGVAAARVIDIEARIVRPETIVGRVVDAAERQRRAEVVALRGVIVDHVQEDLDAGVVEALDHGFEFADRAAGEIALLGREKADRVVAPVVGQTLGEQTPVLDEGLHRHQLDRGDAELEQVVDDRRMAEAGERAAQMRGDPRMAHGHAAHVGLVADRLAPGHAGRLVVAPGIGVVDHGALGHAAGVVAPVEREILAATAQPVGVVGVAPAQLAPERLGVGVEQQLVGIEAVAGRGFVGSMDAVTVEQARVGLRQIAVPHLVGVFRQREARDLPPTLPVEQAQLDFGGIRREQGEVHPAAVPGRAERMRPPRPHGHHRRGHSALLNAAGARESPFPRGAG